LRAVRTVLRTPTRLYGNKLASLHAIRLMKLAMQVLRLEYQFRQGQPVNCRNFGTVPIVAQVSADGRLQRRCRHRLGTHEPPGGTFCSPTNHACYHRFAPACRQRIGADTYLASTIRFLIDSESDRVRPCPDFAESDTISAGLTHQWQNVINLRFARPRAEHPGSVPVFPRCPECVTRWLGFSSRLAVGAFFKSGKVLPRR
jgi:hypothetical protein